jgi:hypothetical protein
MTHEAVRVRPCALQDQIAPAKDPCRRLPTGTPTAWTVRTCTCGYCVRKVGEPRVYAWAAMQHGIP